MVASVTLFILWSGIPQAILQIPFLIGVLAVGAVGIASLLLLLIAQTRQGKALRRIDFIVPAWIAHMLVVSMVSAIAIYPKPASEWLFAIHAYSALLIYFFFLYFRLSLLEVALSISISGLIASVIIVFDQFYPMAWVDLFQRRSFFEEDARRVVFLKNEIAVALVCSVCCLLTPGIRIGLKTLLVPAALICGYCLLIVVESRLALIASALSIIIYVALARGLKLTRRLAIFMVCLGLGVILTPVLGEKYWVSTTSLSDYIENYNVEVRADALTYYYDAFKSTYGLGFGLMKTDGVSPSNIIAVGLGRGFNPEDLGLITSLLQFGVLGFVFSIYVTGFMIRNLIRPANSLGTALGSMCGVLLLASVVSPVPLNVISLKWTSLFGAALLYMARQKYMIHLNREKAKLAAPRQFRSASMN